jgi:anti-anti-sigma factor
MQIDYEQLDGSIVKINLSGRMDVAGSQTIVGKFADLTAPPNKAVIVDLSRVAFLASVGIRTLLVYAKALRTRGGRMVLLNPDANVAKVLELSGVDISIGVFRDLQAACAALAAAPSGGA